MCLLHVFLSLSPSHTHLHTHTHTRTYTHTHTDTHTDTHIDTQTDTHTPLFLYMLANWNTIKHACIPIHTYTHTNTHAFLYDTHFSSVLPKNTHTNPFTKKYRHHTLKSYKTSNTFSFSHTPTHPPTHTHTRTHTCLSLFYLTHTHTPCFPYSECCFE